MSDNRTTDDLGIKLLSTTDATVWASKFVQQFDKRSVRIDTQHTDDVGEGTMIAWFANAIETGRTAGHQDGMAAGTAGWAEYFKDCQLWEVHGRYYDERARHSVGCMAYIVADTQERAKQGFLDANKDRKELKIGTCTVRSYGNRQLVIV
jgi:hypothetical protein